MGAYGIRLGETRVYSALSSPAATPSYKCDGGSHRPGFLKGKNMGMEFKYPEWQIPLQDAIVDLQDKRKLLESETTIRQRLHLLTGSGCFDEQQALVDALSVIRALQREP